MALGLVYRADFIQNGKTKISNQTAFRHPGDDDWDYDPQDEWVRAQIEDTVKHQAKRTALLTKTFLAWRTPEPTTEPTTDLTPKSDSLLGA